jgi:hypothetical protein
VCRFALHEKSGVSRRDVRQHVVVVSSRSAWGATGSTIRVDAARLEFLDSVTIQLRNRVVEMQD